MKIIDVETEDITDIKTIFEILNGFISEANADFIKNADQYNKKLTEKDGKTNSEDKNDSHSKDDGKDDTNDDNEEEDEDVTEKKSSKNKKQNDNDQKNKKEKKTTKKSKKEEPEETQEDEDDEDNDKKKGKLKKKEKKKEKKTKDKDQDEETKKEENKGVIKILTSDPNQVMMTYIVLKGSAFKKFDIQPEKYSVGLNLDELYKYMKNVDKEGTMSISLDSDDTQYLIFDVKSDNSTSQESICELRVLNLIANKDRKIVADVTMAVRINCLAFHKACKDLMQFSQFVEITCDPTQFVITCKGDLSNHSRIFRMDGSQDGVVIKPIKRDDKGPNIIRLVFDLKYINSMYKCSSLCDDMEIYLNPDSVMFLKYGIKLMGEMIVGIAPSTKKKELKEQNQNNAENYDERNDTHYQDDDEIELK